MSDVLITGVERIAGRYLVDVLHKCYVDAGFETETASVDVSYLPCFDESYKGSILALVRNPLFAIPNICVDDRFDDMLRMVEDQGIKVTEDRFIDACNIWLTFTDCAMQRSYGRMLRAEGLGVSRIEQLVLSFNGYEDLVEQAIDVIDSYPTTTKIDEDFLWKDVPITYTVAEYGGSLGYNSHKLLERIQK